METNKGKIFLNTIFWGFILWLWGFILGIIFFAFVPKESIGWYILPLGIVATFWVLFKKIKRKSFVCYIGLGVFWTIIAVVLDYIFIVMLFKTGSYYKPDVYIYYILTFLLPVLTGLYKMNKGLDTVADKV